MYIEWVIQCQYLLEKEKTKPANQKRVRGEKKKKRQKRQKNWKSWAKSGIGKDESSEMLISVKK